MMDLVDTALTPDSVRTAVVCMVVSLEQPWEVLPTLLAFVEKINKRVDECLKQVLPLCRCWLMAR